MKFVHVRVNDKCVARCHNMKDALKIVGSLFKKGHSDIYVYGGSISKWM